MREPGSEEDVARDFIPDTVTKHQNTCTGHADVEYVGEDVCDVDGFTVLVRVAHVAIDVREDAMAAPGRHQKTNGKRDRHPVIREEVLGGRVAYGARSFRFDDTIGPDSDCD